MKIEFSFPHGEVPGLVIEYVKDKLLGYHRDNKEVSDAEVIFRIMPEVPEVEKHKFVCMVILSLFGETLVVQRGSLTYLKAAREVITEIETRLDEILKRINEPPEEVLTTIVI
jgi:hypothetical protein